MHILINIVMGGLVGLSNFPHVEMSTSQETYYGREELRRLWPTPPFSGDFSLPLDLNFNGQTMAPSLPALTRQGTQSTTSNISWSTPSLSPFIMEMHQPSINASWDPPLVSYLPIEPSIPSECPSVLEDSLQSLLVCRARIIALGLSKRRNSRLVHPTSILPRTFPTSTKAKLCSRLLVRLVRDVEGTRIHPTWSQRRCRV